MHVKTCTSAWRHSVWHYSRLHSWITQEPYGVGDTVGLELDVDNGTLVAWKNGRRLGLMATGLAGTRARTPDTPSPISLSSVCL